MRLPHFRVRTLMLAVGVVARLGCDDGDTIVRLLQAREGIQRKARMAGKRRQGSRDSYAYAGRSVDMGSADCRILRPVGPEVSPSNVAASGLPVAPDPQEPTRSAAVGLIGRMALALNRKVNIGR